jgi:UDP-N-acetylglucosamine--N-acetylmuramyl-(pentapeptide) pyrophosphoryl-undecaprenol N-acetylglucosamine transferase
MKTLLVCERSAGHIFPALAFAECFVKQKKCKKDEVYFFITATFLSGYIQERGFSVIGKSLKSRNIVIEGLWRFFEAIYIIIKLRPRKVIGFGGRDSFFLVLFCSFFPIATTIYEPNLKMGKANRILSFFTGKILRGFEYCDKNKKAKVIGIPLRPSIKKIDKTEARKALDFNRDPVVLCLGGSQGSVFINQIFLKFVQNYKDPLQIIHLTGKNEYFQIQQLYNKIKKNSFVKEFYYNMEVLYSAADVVFSRAGAVTLSEISFYRSPAVIIPHPKAGGHQRANALYFKKMGAAIIYEQDNFSFNDFNNSFKELICSYDAREKLKRNLEKIKIGISYEEFINHSIF